MTEDAHEACASLAENRRNVGRTRVNWSIDNDSLERINLLAERFRVPQNTAANLIIGKGVGTIGETDINEIVMAGE